MRGTAGHGAGERELAVGMRRAVWIVRAWPRRRWSYHVGAHRTRANGPKRTAKAIKTMCADGVRRPRRLCRNIWAYGALWKDFSECARLTYQESLPSKELFVVRGRIRTIGFCIMIAETPMPPAPERNDRQLVCTSQLFFLISTQLSPAGVIRSPVGSSAVNGRRSPE